MESAEFWSPDSKFDNVPSSKGKSGVPAQKIVGGFMAKRISKGLCIAVFIVVLILGIFSLVVVRPVYKVVGRAKVLSGDIGTISKAFVDRDLVTVEAALDKTEVDLEELRTAKDQNLGWMKNIPLVSAYLTDVDSFVGAGDHIVEATRKAVELIKPFASAAGLRVSENQEVEQKSLVEAFSNWIAVMPQVAEGSDEVIAELGEAGKELANVDPRRYPKKLGKNEISANISRAQSVLTQLNDAAPDIKQALTIIPGLLGVGTSEQRYMVIMQNDKELRPTGGFWTNYATFKISDAMLSSDFTSKDMYSIDDALDAIDAYYDFPDAPAPYTKYLKVEHWYARDTNSSPDFPTSIDQFMYFYNLASRVSPLEIKPVEGVFAIDTQFIGELIDITGPVTVNGVTYSSDNVVLELEKIASLELQQQIGRKRVLGDLMEAMLVNVFESDANLWSKLIEKGIDLATRKHLLVYLFNTDAQALVEKYNLGGRIKDPVEGDYSMVVSTNLGGDKTNWFVTKNVDHTLEKEGNRWVRTVKITYTYDQPSEAYAPFVKRFRDWVRVYVPQGSELISVEGSADSFGEAEERGKVAFDGYTEIGPGESTTMTFKYYLPDGVVTGDVYNLYVQKQAGVNGDTYTVTVNGKTEKIDLLRDYKYSTKL